MTTFGVIVSNRSFFPDHLVASTRERLLKTLEEEGYGVVTLSPEETRMGQTMTREEASQCARLFQTHAKEIDGILVCLPNFGEEAGVADAIRESGLDCPILVQASADDPGKLQLSDRRDAFCGKLSVCSNLYQYGRAYSVTTRHVCDVGGSDFRQDLQWFSGVCRVVKVLRTARIAQLGTRVPPFRTVRYSEKLLQRSGITVEVADMSEILAAAVAEQDSEAVRAKVEEIRSYAHVVPDISDEKVDRQARLCLAVEQWVRDRDCAASAVQCWENVQNNYGCAMCLSMSMMGEGGRPSACETDVMGALSMLALQSAAGSKPLYQDWNNNYGDDPDKCINVHCSNYPVSVFDQRPDLGNLDILATTLGTEVSFGALKGRVRPGDMTFLKISTDDVNGRIRCYLGEGQFTGDPLDTFGGVAVCEIKNLNGLMRYLAKNGFEHHVALVHGHVADILEEALGHYLGWDVYRHNE